MDEEVTDLVPNDIRDLEADLLYLRKRAGVTPGRMASVETLRLLLGGDGQPYNELRDRLDSAIRSLHDEEAALLLDVFALSPDTNNLSTLRERRQHHGTKISRKIDTVAGRETRAITNLRNQLLTGWYPTSRSRPARTYQWPTTASSKTRSRSSPSWKTATDNRPASTTASSPCSTKQTTSASPTHSPAPSRPSHHSQSVPTASPTHTATTSTTNTVPCAEAEPTTPAIPSAQTQPSKATTASKKPAAPSANEHSPPPSKSSSSATPQTPSGNSKD